MSRRLPLAPPTTPEVRARMQRMPRRDTQPEIALRRKLHGRGLRYRTSVRPLHGLRCEADIVFAGPKVACFVDSCHWHGCDQHFRLPRTNTEWWRDKIAWTKERDERNNAALRAAGWTVLRVWEHEDPSAAADRISSVLDAAARCQRPGGSPAEH